MTDVSIEATTTLANGTNGRSAAALVDVVRRADEVVIAAQFAAEQAIRRARQAARAKTDEAVKHLERVREESDQLEAIAIQVVESAHADADATVTSARCEAAIIIDNAHHRAGDITEEALQRAADLNEASHIASKEILAQADDQAEVILATARENAHRIIQDAEGQATGIDERVRDSTSFSTMWDSAHEGSGIEDFFAGMKERNANEVFKR